MFVFCNIRLLYLGHGFIRRVAVSVFTQDRFSLENIMELLKWKPERKHGAHLPYIICPWKFLEFYRFIAMDIAMEVCCKIVETVLTGLMRRGVEHERSTSEVLSDSWATHDRWCSCTSEAWALQKLCRLRMERYDALSSLDRFLNTPTHISLDPSSFLAKRGGISTRLDRFTRAFPHYS